MQNPYLKVYVYIMSLVCPWCMKEIEGVVTAICTRVLTETIISVTYGDILYIFILGTLNVESNWSNLNSTKSLFILLNWA